MSSRRGRPTQTADSLPFDTTGSDFSPSTVSTVGDALRELDQITIDTLTEFESFGSPSEETTTSNSLITNSGDPYTTGLKSAGKDCIDYSAQIGQGSNNNISQLVVEYREGISGTWTVLLDTQQELRDTGFVPWSGFSIVTLNTNTVFQVRIRYANPGTGSCLIREANIKIGKVSD